MIAMISVHPRGSRLNERISIRTACFIARDAQYSLVYLTECIGGLVDPPKNPETQWMSRHSLINKMTGSQYWAVYFTDRGGAPAVHCQ